MASEDLSTATTTTGHDTTTFLQFRGAIRVTTQHLLLIPRTQRPFSNAAILAPVAPSQAYEARQHCSLLGEEADRIKLLQPFGHTISH